ncbi:helix-turn-helix domain-containing protein [Paenibacillus sp. PL91]|uniref:helix-turn-helix domain-containing protein n=1 Tax=Paenibacillus sp. PL91 TaxID=2729538 RepID=UPI00145E230E|nr:helix-turn-helix domain-containing protein [Paenibacillus sp. PL91]MBC9201217.1 helix-turn-helix domain-containing protein [Paenibacillus sp. PL91]
MVRNNGIETIDETNGGALLSGLFYESDSYRYRRPSGMSDWLIFYTLEGEGYLRTPHGEKRCRSGQIGLLRSGIPHEYGTVSGSRWVFYWAHFQKLPEIDYLPNEECIVATVPDGNMQSRVQQTFHHILNDSRERASFWHMLCENSLREVILLSAQLLERRLDPRIELALQYLSRNMQQSVRIDDLAKSVGLSVSRLSHLFKQETGASVLDHLNRLRLQQAALLMEHMGRTATEASLDVGFYNYNHFAALFRKTYGISPRTYKKDKAAHKE